MNGQAAAPFVFKLWQSFGKTRFPAVPIVVDRYSPRLTWNRLLAEIFSVNVS
jgi:hypothetical protein